MVNLYFLRMLQKTARSGGIFSVCTMLLVLMFPLLVYGGNEAGAKGAAAGNTAAKAGVSAGNSVEEAFTEAQAYTYVRFWVNEEEHHIKELRWLVGETEFPRQPLTSLNSDGIEVITSSHPLKAFDGDPASHWYMNGAVHYVTLKSTIPVYATGISITTPSWNRLESFTAEGSNNGTDWVTLYEAANIPSDAYGERDANGNITGIFNFGFTLPDDYEEIPVYTLTVTNGNGSGSYEVGEVVSISALAEPGKVFTGWAGDVENVADVNSASTTMTMPAYDANIEALFEERETTVAEGYTYVRLWIDENPQHVKEVKWLIGDSEFPLAPLTSANSNGVIVTSSSTNAADAPFKAFDGDPASHWYASGANHHVTLQSQIPLYVTGIALSAPSWSLINAFRAEGSKNGTDWVPLYAAADLTTADYGPTIDGNKTAIFDFGFTLPDDFDNDAPSVPAGLEAAVSSSMTADLSWSASEDASGVAFYEIFVDGYPWSSSPDETATIHGLSPLTTYEVSVSATDILGNSSEKSASVQITTPALAPAVGSMQVGTNFWFRIDRSNDMAWREGADFTTDENPYNPVFLEDIRPYDVLRMMDWTSTNNNPIVHWEDRRLPGDPVQEAPYTSPGTTVPRKGVAFEWQIALANLTNADLWLTLPHKVNDNFVTQLARLVKNTLNPELKVYVEYSNEVWNPGFDQAAYALEQGEAMGFGTGTEARGRYYVYRSLQIHELFEQEFAGQEERMIKVIAGQSVNTWLTGVHMAALEDATINPKGRTADYYSVAPYFGPSNAGTYPTIEAVAAEMEKQIDIQIQRVAEQYQIVTTKGLRLNFYEAGQHVTSGATAINTSPVIYDLYIRYLNGISPYSDLIAHYTHVAPSTSGNSFNAKEYTGQPNILAYKYRALLDWQQVNGSEGGPSAPIILSPPQSIVANEYENLELSVIAVGTPPMAYQWYVNDEPIEGANKAALPLGLARLNMTGDSYYVTIENEEGLVTSNTVTVTVNEVVKATIHQTGTAPLVDGAVDAAWEKATAYTLDNVNSGSVENDADLSGSYRMLWDSEHLYVLVEVKDQTLVPYPGTGQSYQYDGVEVYIDADFSRGTSYDGINDYQYIYSPGIELLTGTRDNTAGMETAEQLTDGGYVVEIKMPWATLGVTPVAGNPVGIDVMIMDNDNGTTREAKKAWHATNDMLWSNPSLFGVGELKGITYSLEVTANHGTVAISPEQDFYEPGTMVSLTATAEEGYQFTGWSGDITGSESTITVAMDADKQLTANFSLIPYTFLKFEVTTAGGTASLVEVDWLADGLAYPSIPMRSPNPTEEVALTSNYIEPDKAWFIYSDIASMQVPVSSPTEFTLEFLEAPLVPTGIRLMVDAKPKNKNKNNGTISSIRCWGSNDGINWRLLFEDEEAAAAFATTSGGLQLAEFQFYASASSSSKGAQADQRLNSRTLNSSLAGAAIMVYPNPSNDVINVSVGEDLSGASYQMINSLGKVVRNGALGGGDSNASSAQIKVSDLPAGMYILKVGDQFRRVVKQQ